MKIAWLTTSRADWGICLPLIHKLKNHPNVDLEVIATGAHLMMEHGNTIEEVRKLGLRVHEVPVVLDGKNAESVAKSYGTVAQVFADFWTRNQDFNLVFALGDRYEMAAALLASIPFRIPIAHLCGGDVTDGATDQMYRDMISVIAQYHFATEDKSAERIRQLKQPYHDQAIANVGSLSIEQMKQHDGIGSEEFMSKWGIDLNGPFYLITLHPETMELGKNLHHVSEVQSFLKRAIAAGQEQWLVTLPNADAESELWRDMLLSLSFEYPERVKCHAHLGVRGYYTAMKNCKAMIGNTSSGIVESATMGAWVLNLGDRQKGRSRNLNVTDVEFDQEALWKQWLDLPNDRYIGPNLYGDGDSSQKIMDILKVNFDELR